MESLVYRHERTLGRITLVLGLIAWVLILVATFGALLFYVLLAFVVYLFAQSALISYLKGTGVRITATQQPDLHASLVHCCGKLGIAELPEAYLLNGGGMLNAFATRFLGRDFVVLLSDVVDAMERHPDGIHFYMGHELGHIRMKHLTGHVWRIPVLWLPLLGAAYSRAQESTCDLHGRACCQSPESAARAMVALAAGPQRWSQVDLVEYARQTVHNAGFWSSFHELTSAYPWLTKRLARVLQPTVTMPARHPAAYFLALFVPYGGRAGGGAAGFVVLVAMVGILAAVALPAYQQYTRRAAVAQAWQMGTEVRAALGAHYQKNGEQPDTLAEAGAPTQLADGSRLRYDVDTMNVEVRTKAGVLQMHPVPEEEDGPVRWYCVAGTGMAQGNLPQDCREAEQE